MNNIQPVYLGTTSYTAYLAGAEVQSSVDTNNKKMEPGQHVMVFKDTVAASTSLPVPADKESESIGVEGMVIQVNSVTDMKKGTTQQQLKVKRL